MIFANPDWIEVGDQWYIYYAGVDSPHPAINSTPGIGLATIRKKGFVSLRGPRHGGVVCTRRILWPGDNLPVNCNTRLPDQEQGELKVRIVNSARKAFPGFNYEDSVPFQGASTAYQVTWKERGIDELQGKVRRLEFFLTRADLYTFQATPAEKE